MHLASSTKLVRIEVDHIPEINSSVLSHSYLQGITRLELNNVHLQRIEPGSFRNMSRLEYLVIVHNNITVLKGNTFEGLLNLYFLDLSDNSTSKLESRVFSGLLNLRHFEVRFNNIDPLPYNALEGLRNHYDCELITIPIIQKFLLLSTFNPEILRYLCGLTHFLVGDSSFRNIPSYVSLGLTIGHCIQHLFVRTLVTTSLG